MRCFIHASLLVTLSLFAVAVTKADEEKVALDKLPKAVLDTAKKRFPGAELIGGSKETADGKTEYEVELKHKGQHIDLTTTPEGVIVSIEKTIPEKDLPKAAAAGIAKKYSDAKYAIVEEVHHVKDGKEFLDYYEVVLVAKDKKKWEVCVTAEGKITKDEEKKGE